MQCNGAENVKQKSAAEFGECFHNKDVIVEIRGNDGRKAKDSKQKNTAEFGECLQDEDVTVTIFGE